MKFANFVPSPMKTTVVRITSYEHKIPCGSLSSPFYAEHMHFSGIMELLLLVERIQDDLAYPERAMDFRCFEETESSVTNTCLHTPPEEKALGTFKLSVFFRQSATWQGSLKWVDKNEVANFRSVFELLKLLDSALDSAA